MSLDPFLQQSQENVQPALGTLQRGQKMFGGRFVLERHLGQGGMGQVWLAQDTTLMQRRALKFVLPALLSDSLARRRLCNEARLGTDLAHPRIVRVFDFVEENGDSPLAAVVMEYVDGRTLSDLLAEKHAGFFEPEEIERWVQDVIVGLQYAHEEKQRFHLDLKPANIMVETSTGHAKLLDFGISRSAKDTLTRLTGQVSSGTLPYMSPQQLDGEPPCAADDVYGLGATVYELLTGTPPFFRGKLDDQIRSKVPDSIEERRRQNAKEGLNPGMGKETAEWNARVLNMLDKAGDKRLFTAMRPVQPPQKSEASGGSPSSQTPPTLPVQAEPESIDTQNDASDQTDSLERGVIFWISIAGSIALVVVAYFHGTEMHHQTNSFQPFQFGQDANWGPVPYYQNVFLGASIASAILLLVGAKAHASDLRKNWALIAFPSLALLVLASSFVTFGMISSFHDRVTEPYQFEQWAAAQIQSWLPYVFTENIVAGALLCAGIVHLVWKHAFAKAPFGIFKG